jgi:hypothetical protein
MSLGSRFIVVAAGLLAAPLAVRLERPVDVKPPMTAVRVDGRTVRLARFFSKLHCPVKDLAADFVRVADKNRLDWRLLPSISVVESGGGKAYRNNNIFGWGNGDLKFPSIKAGLQEVASKLSRSPLYRNRDSFGKLRVYNPDEQYALRVIDVMNQI